MKKYFFRVVRASTGAVVSQNKRPHLALSRAKLLGPGHVAQRRDLDDDAIWHDFDQWPTREAVQAEDRRYAARWRERKDMIPYYMTDAGQAIGIDGLHALGLELAELEAIGLLELLPD